MVDQVGFGLEILGVFCGVGLAFLLDRLADRAAERKEYRRVLGIIKQELEDNLPILEKLKADFEKNPKTQGYSISYYHLRFGIWQGVSSKVDTIRNEMLLAEIGQVYSMYDMFERTLDSYLELVLAALKNYDPAIRQIENGLENRRIDMLNQMKDEEKTKELGLFTVTNDAILSIKREIDQLDC